MTDSTAPKPYAWSSFLLFLIGAAVLSSLDLAERANWIDKTTEAVGRLVVLAAMIGFLVLLAVRTNIAPLIRNVTIVFVASLLLQVALSMTHDMASLDGAVLIGRDGFGHNFVNKLAAAVWLCCGFFLMYLLLMSAKQLTIANEQLSAEVELRQQAERELDQSNRSLEATVRQRTGELEEALDKLKSAQQKVIQQEQLSAVGRLASGMAHELKNTLSPAVTYAELLKIDSTLSPQQREWSDALHQSATDAIAIIGELRQFHAPDENSTLQPVDLRDILEQVASRTRPRWKDATQLHARRIELQLDLQSTDCVNGDATELRQLFTNLVLNAIDAVADGGQISIRLFQADGDVVVEVKDNGPGMPEEAKARCFEPFFTTKSTGVGMGLSICHGIVARHQGQIDVDSQPGGGTSFQVRLPATSATPPTVESIAPELASDLRVLLIDDDESVRRGMAALLSTLGVSVYEAKNGAAGLQTLNESEIDVVVTDMGMSDMQGSQVVRAIRETHLDTPVILISGWSESEITQAFRDQPLPDAILEKPASLDTLLPVLRQWQPTSGR